MKATLTSMIGPSTYTAEILALNEDNTAQARIEGEAVDLVWSDEDGCWMMDGYPFEMSIGGFLITRKN